MVKVYFSMVKNAFSTSYLSSSISYSSSFNLCLLHLSLYMHIWWLCDCETHLYLIEAIERRRRNIDDDDEEEEGDLIVDCVTWERKK